MNYETVEELHGIIFDIKEEIAKLGDIHNHIYYPQQEIDPTLTENVIPEVIEKQNNLIGQLEAILIQLSVDDAEYQKVEKALDELDNSYFESHVVID